ncbi:arylesterase [Cognatilysobacter segetis]|uniref:arylesterase n=1 Tax=Cognatilysobacter segetis TaxID=2492394 RepID=UPI001EE4576A|nr:arylesterase [Lysobacter segetis]
MNPAYEGMTARIQRRLWWLVMAMALLVALPVQARTPAKQAPVTTKTVLVMGDSLSAGYGIAVQQGWVSLLGQRLKATNPGWKVVNASVSGETTAGGLSRLPRELSRVKPAVVVIELGANDGLRGLPVRDMQANLDRMTKLSKASGAKVLLLGMRMPPNLGRAYTEGFANAYTGVARGNGASLVPFFLEPIVMQRAAFQRDNLHPTAPVQGKLLDHVWPALRPLMK